MFKPPQTVASCSTVMPAAAGNNDDALLLCAHAFTVLSTCFWMYFSSMALPIAPSFLLPSTILPSLNTIRAGRPYT